MASSTLLKVCTFAILLQLCINLFGVASSIPLGVRSRWIVDEATGRRVKLACVNWVGHLQPGLPEGLNHQPISSIATNISSLGFNCVRLTYSIHMLTKPYYTKSSVGLTFESLNLTAQAKAIELHNPGVLQLTHLQAYKRVVDVLSIHGVMVVLDNHVSKPQWCCSTTDGNGFFGDRYFNPTEWLFGLTRIASYFRATPNVVAMSLRNELRGNRSSASGWSKYMQMGAARVHRANPNVLVILSGLRFDTDLSFLPNFPVTLPFKIVYEVHWYSFGTDWAGGHPNGLCGNTTAQLERRAGFVTESNNGTSAPLFISEFGIDQRGINENDNRYLNCFLAYAAEGDFDWALWALGGSYYLREDSPSNRFTFEETYGLFNATWNGLRDTEYISRLHSIQQPIQDPDFTSDAYYQIIYHPATGLCVESAMGNNITLGSCNSAGSRWSYDASVEGPIGLLGTPYCIATQGNGLPPILTEDCSAPKNTMWSVVSSSNLQVATVNGDDNKLVCLDGSSSAILMKDCICVKDSECSTDNPESQWFKVITTNRKIY